MSELVEAGRVVKWIQRWSNEMPNEVAKDCALLEQRLEQTQAKLEAMEQPIRELRQRYEHSTRPWTQIVKEDWAYILGIVERLLSAQQQEEQGE